MSGVPGARWQDDDQLHVTLRFIGEVDGRMAEDVAHVLGTVRAAALSLRIEGAGRFDTRGRANALWAGIQPREPIAALHRKVDQALVRCGLPPESRAYLPHLTVARLGRAAGPVEPWLTRHGGLTSPTFDITHMMLFESHSGSEGARYDTIARYPLVA
jgi:RNA 2',3'-cyclic 3'-phosphodiesterase